MRKEYRKPTTRIVHLELERMIANSPEVHITSNKVNGAYEALDKDDDVPSGDYEDLW